MKPKAYSYIRMSTPEQMHGDSRRRQLAKTERYAEDHGLELVDRYDDLGVSAYRGKNAGFGSNLRRFIQAIDDGVVGKGSYLIVESMDRLSRNTAISAMGLLSEIISRGVAIVTLDDGQTYSQEILKNNQMSLMIALGAMVRAHEESRRKSGLLSDTWDEKKRLARAERKVMTRRMPGWLELDEASGKIVTIAHRADVVREIFRLVRDGWGAYSVARHLNERGEMPWSKRKRAVWRESYIKKVIASRTVLGEYQPHKSVDDPTRLKARVPDGPPVFNYYPSVVNERLFKDAQLAMSRRRTGARGRKGARYSNLFTGLLRCQCGGGYRYIYKGGNRAKGKGRYLQCSIAFSKGPCQIKPFRYGTIEDTLLDAMESLDLQKVYGGKAKNIRLSEKKEELGRLQDNKAELEARTERLLQIAQADDSAAPIALRTELKKLEQQDNALASEIKRLESEIDEILQADPEKHKALIKRLMAEIRTKDGSPKNEHARRALASELQRVVQYVRVDPNVRFVHEAVSDDEDWKKTWGVRSEHQLEKRFRDYGFEFVIVYRNGNRHHVDALKGLYFRHKGSLKEKTMRFLAAGETSASPRDSDQ